MHEYILKFGSLGPVFLFFITLYILSSTSNFFYVYIIGIIINTILNLVLKKIIAEPRPQRSTYKAKVIGDNYGMPSGHAQSCAFTLFYVWSVLEDFNIFILYFIITIISIWSRDYSGYHTKQQLIAGLLIGGLVGKILYTYVKNKITGEITTVRNDFTYKTDHPFFGMVHNLI